MKKKHKKRVTRLTNSCNHLMKFYPILLQVPQMKNSHQVHLVHKINASWMIDYVSGDELSDDDITTHFALFVAYNPMAFEEVVKDTKWQKAMDTEIKAIKKNDTLELFDLPQGQKTIGVKWVYKTKLNEKGEVDKYKAWLVVKGYKQEFVVD